MDDWCEDNWIDMASWRDVYSADKPSGAITRVNFPTRTKNLDVRTTFSTQRLHQTVFDNSKATK